MEIDESAYAAAARELDCNQARPGLLARCQAEAGGDETGARARYIAVRAQEMAAGRRQIAVKTLAETYQAAPAVVVRSHSPAPPPQERTSSPWWYLGAVAVGLAAVALLVQVGVPEGLRPVVTASLASVAPRPPNPVVVRSECAFESPDLEAGSLVGVAVKAVDALFKDATVVVEMTVRNSGASGDIDVLAVLEQDREPYVTQRRETVYLEAGEQRDLDFVFPEAAAGAEGGCRVGAVLPGQQVAGL